MNNTSTEKKERLKTIFIGGGTLLALCVLAIGIPSYILYLTFAPTPQPVTPPSPLEQAIAACGPANPHWVNHKIEGVTLDNWKSFEGVYTTETTVDWTVYVSEVEFPYESKWVRVNNFSLIGRLTGPLSLHVEFRQIKDDQISWVPSEISDNEAEWYFQMARNVINKGAEIWTNQFYAKYRLRYDKQGELFSIECPDPIW